MGSGMHAVDIRSSSETTGWLWLVGIVVLFAVGCGAADDASKAPTVAKPVTTSPYSSARQQPPPPAIIYPDGSISDFEVVDQAIEGLITRNAAWQAPASLQVNKTENVALSIGDVQSLQEEITRTVPTVSPRQPQEIDIGSRVSASLVVGEQDAMVAPLEAIDKSIGEQTSILFSWQVTPLKAGELILSAHIEFPLAQGYVQTQIVPLRIPAAPAEQVKQPWTRTFKDVITNYWVQLTTAGGALLAGARLGWGWYKRRRAVSAGAAVDEGPTVEQPSPTNQPASTGGAGRMDTERR
jgi:hypothetical protein